MSAGERLIEAPSPALLLSATGTLAPQLTYSLDSPGLVPSRRLLPHPHPQPALPTLLGLPSPAGERGCNGGRWLLRPVMPIHHPSQHRLGWFEALPLCAGDTLGPRARPATRPVCISDAREYFISGNTRLLPTYWKEASV